MPKREPSPIQLKENRPLFTIGGILQVSTLMQCQVEH